MIEGHATLRQSAYEYIRARLLSGDLPPGARLVNRVLARQIGASAIPVREAISRLATEGLVEEIPGAGAFVRRPDAREAEILFDLREAIEPLATREAARHITPSELAAVDRLCEECRRLAAEFHRRMSAAKMADFMRRWWDNDERFHDIILQASRSVLLTGTLRELRNLAHVQAVHRKDPRPLTPGLADRTVKVNLSIARCLHKRDEAGARHWMAEHIRDGRIFTLGG